MRPRLRPLHRVAILTLGCKLNQADSDSLARRFASAGCSVGSEVEGADVVVINSCTVTHVADSKARQLVRRARRVAPGSSIVLTGCYVDSGGGPAGLHAGADLALPNKDKGRIVDDVFTLRTGLPPDPAAAGERPPLRGLRSRAFIKIQEGCDDVCSFCIVPRVRGREDSRTIEEIVAEARLHAASGAQEIVLTGTQLGHYGRDRGWEAGPRRLLATLLRETPVPRIRISSLQAQDLSGALLELWQDKRLCPHFHIPLQSGSDAILRAMRRRYDSARYEAAVELVQRHVPGAAVTTDIIAGFPGETGGDFQASLDLVRKVGFAAVHVFPYSVRKGTGAAFLSGHVQPEVKRHRTDELIKAGRIGARIFRRALAGSQHDVLWEDSPGPDLWSGLTANYVRVQVTSRLDLANRITSTTLAGLHGDVVEGSIDEMAPGSALAAAS